MADIYCRRTAGGGAGTGSATSPYDTWAKAAITFKSAAEFASPGDTVWVADDHEEDVASSATVTCTGTLANPVKIYCGDPATEPPTVRTTGAIVSTNAGINYTILGNAYIYGAMFRIGAVGNTQAGLFILNSNSNNNFPVYEKCTFWIRNTHISSRLSLGSNAVSDSPNRARFINCTTRFGNVSQSISCRGIKFDWINNVGETTGAFVDSAGSIPTTLFGSGGAYGGIYNFKNLDLSSSGSGKNILSMSAGTNSTFKFVRCKTDAAVSLTTGTPVIGGVEGEFIQCGSGDSFLDYYYKSALGTIEEDGTDYRTGGASAQSAGWSFLVTPTNATYDWPLMVPLGRIFNATEGSAITVTAHLLSTASLNNDKVWLEVDYLGENAKPTGFRATSKIAVGDTPAALDASAEAWAVPDVEMQVDVTFTPQTKGQIEPWLAVCGTTALNICPKVVIS